MARFQGGTAIGLYALLFVLCAARVRSEGSLGNCSRTLVQEVAIRVSTASLESVDAKTYLGFRGRTSGIVVPRDSTYSSGATRCLHDAHWEGISTGSLTHDLAPATNVPGSVLLAERGACSFVQKAYAAQAAGAAGLVVYNDDGGTATAIPLSNPPHTPSPF
eukprot:106838-Pyramimonas_sp.AAC.2